MLSSEPAISSLISRGQASRKQKVIQIATENNYTPQYFILFANGFHVIYIQILKHVDLQRETETFTITPTRNRSRYIFMKWTCHAV